MATNSLSDLIRPQQPVTNQLSGLVKIPVSQSILSAQQAGGNITEEQQTQAIMDAMRTGEGVGFISKNGGPVTMLSRQAGTYFGQKGQLNDRGGIDIQEYNPYGNNTVRTISAQQIAQDDAMLKQRAWEHEMNRRMIEAKVAEQEMKARGGEIFKPVFNTETGGYVYPPSQENPQGKFVPVAGFSKPDKPLTEYQGQSVMFGTRAADANNLLNSIEDKISVGGLKAAQGAEEVPIIGGLLGAAGHAMLSADQQRVDQAQRNFINAVMRRESGATISPSEFDNARKQYFPQVGDDPVVLEQKRRNREMVINGFARGAGGGGKDIMEVFNSNPYKKSNAPAGGVKFLGFE